MSHSSRPVINASASVLAKLSSVERGGSPLPFSIVRRQAAAVKT